MFDEGKTHKGRTEIQYWNFKTNKEYKTIVKPLDYNEIENSMSAEISGTFEGSSLILKYHFEIVNEQIQSLKIKG